MINKLEITSKLEELESVLDSSIAILNLPGANLCEKRSQLIDVDGSFEQACKGCVTQRIKLGNRLTIPKIRGMIDFFVKTYGTRFITINGRGDPFHPILQEETLEKISSAHEKGVQAYVFTAGNNLTQEICDSLAEHEANVTISLFGNQFIDADFFYGREYTSNKGRFQNQARIAENLRRLIKTYARARKQPAEGLTRLAMNYVISERDLLDETKIANIKQAANKTGIAFVCNSDFELHPDRQTMEKLSKLSRKYADFNLPHSTFVIGKCQMGAGSSATIDFDGTLFRCPYLTDEGDGNINFLTEEGLKKVVEGYMKDKKFTCTYRKT